MSTFVLIDFVSMNFSIENLFLRNKNTKTKLFADFCQISIVDIDQ